MKNSVTSGIDEVFKFQCESCYNSTLVSVKSEFTDNSLDCNGSIVDIIPTIPFNVKCNRCGGIMRAYSVSFDRLRNALLLFMPGNMIIGHKYENPKKLDNIHYTNGVICPTYKFPTYHIEFKNPVSDEIKDKFKELAAKTDLYYAKHDWIGDTDLVIYMKESWINREYANTHKDMNSFIEYMNTMMAKFANAWAIQILNECEGETI